MWAALGQFFGEILKAIFPTFFDEYRKPSEIEVAGFDDEIEDDIDYGIDEEFGFLSNQHMDDKHD